MINFEKSVDAEYVVNAASEIPRVSRLSFTENSKKHNNDILGLQNKGINGDSIAESDPNHQRFISKYEDMENSMTRMKMESSASMDAINRNGKCCKIAIVFGMCGTIGCCLIPIILFYATQATSRENSITDPGYSFEKNISSAQVRMLY